MEKLSEQFCRPSFELVTSRIQERKMCNFMQCDICTVIRFGIIDMQMYHKAIREKRVEKSVYCKLMVKML
jgi:hypothetical protein